MQLRCEDGLHHLYHRERYKDNIRTMHAELQLDNQICFRLYTAARLITQAYTPMLNELGITYPQYLVLMVLWEQD